MAQLICLGRKKLLSVRFDSQATHKDVESKYNKDLKNTIPEPELKLSVFKIWYDWNLALQSLPP